MQITVNPCCPTRASRGVTFLAKTWGKLGFHEPPQVEDWAVVGEDGSEEEFCPHCGSKHEIEDEQVSKNPIVYLACPYSHEDKKVRDLRLKAVSFAALRLIDAGCVVFSPLNQSCGMLRATREKDAGWEYWKKTDLGLVAVCDYLFVLTLDGWEDSIGVKAEIAEAKKLRKMIVFWDGKKEVEV